MRSALLAVVCVLLLIPVASDARTWLVRQDGSGDCTTIQACVSLSHAGDSVLVGPGTYSEHLSIAVPLSLIGELGSSQTTIDGGDQYKRCITCSHTSGKVVVVGFTITRGGISTVCPPNNFGGGVFCFSGELEIRGCVMTSNFGGGIGCASGSTVSVLECDFSGNYGEWGWGGCDIPGNCVAGDGAVGRIERCKMWVADWSGIRWQGGQLEAISNEIYNEDSGPIPHSSGIRIDSANPALIRGNLVIVEDNGILVGRSTLTMEYNTVVGQKRYGLSLGQCTGSVNNNIMASGGEYGIGCSSPGTVVFSCNDVWNNTLGNYEGDCASSTDISVDPLFCDPSAGNYHLNCTSPCANAPACGRIGAFDVACGATAIRETTWGRIKALYR